MTAVLDGFVAAIMSAGDSSSPFAVGTVTKVDSGAAADGNVLATVTWKGTPVRAAYASSYTPVVDHTVLMARMGPRLVILCRVIGTPPNS